MNRLNIYKMIIFTFIATLIGLNILLFYEIKQIKLNQTIFIDVNIDYNNISEDIKKDNTQINNKTIKNNENIYTITAYDNSPEDQGQWVNTTATGYSLKNKSRSEAKCIAVDPKIIPLGSKVKIEFLEDSYKIYDGYYIARDTGGAIKGKRIDLFLGDGNKKKEVNKFGKTKAKVKIIKE